MEAFCVSGFAFVVAERLFIEVSEQVKRLNRNVRALDRPLQQRPEVFHAVGMHVTVHVALSVVDYLVGILAVQAIVREQFIGHYLGAFADTLANDLAEFALAPRADVMDADLSGIAFEQPEYDLFTARPATMDLFFALVLVHEACRAADEGLVRFHRAGHLVDRSGMGGVANAVHHEPRGLLRDFEVLTDFVAANTVLAICHHPHSAEPFVQPYGGILEDRTDLDGELLFAVLALPNKPRGKVGSTLAVTSRTHGLTVGPLNSSNLVNAGLGVAVVPYGAHQTTVFADVVVFHTSILHPEER